MINGTGRLVVHGPPNTFNCNRGVTVVYDQLGQAWLELSAFNEEAANAFEKMIRDYGLTTETDSRVHVPHSNDDMRFMLEVRPMLQRRRH